MDFKCKYCGSVNLELEEKGNQTGLYCCDCGKWLKWVTKEEKRVFNKQNDCTPIYVSNEATNGDILMALFNVEILFVSKQFNVITVRYDNHSKTYDYDWWNAPYKKVRNKYDN